MHIVREEVRVQTDNSYSVVEHTKTAEALILSRFPLLSNELLTGIGFLKAPKAQSNQGGKHAVYGVSTNGLLNQIYILL